MPSETISKLQGLGMLIVVAIIFGAFFYFINVPKSVDLKISLYCPLINVSTYNGIAYNDSKIVALEKNTGNVASIYALNTQSGSLEDHMFIYSLNGSWVDGGVFDASKLGSSIIKSGGCS